MSALSTRDALAKALHALDCSRCGMGWSCGRVSVEDEDRADALIASGAVVDVAALADDEALVDAVSDIAYRGQHLSATHVRVLLLTVAKALTERAS